MKAMVGSTILSNSFDAGVEVVKNSTKGIKIPKIGFLFSSEKYNHEELLRGAKSLETGMKIIGCTSSGAIMTPDGIISNEEGYAGMLVIEDNELNLGIASSPRGNDPRATGRKLAKEAMLNAGKKFSPVAFAMFATPKDEELYLKGIQDEIGEVPMFGGSASDEEMNGTWKVFCDGSSYEDGCVVAFFYTTKKIKNIFTGAYNETEKMGIITRIEDDKTISEIDNEPALQKYIEWTGLELEEAMGENLLINGTKYPLGVKTIQGDLLAVRQPIFGNEDLSFKVNTKITDKIAVIQLENDEDGLIEGAAATAREVQEDFKVGALLLIHSAYRKLCIGERIDEDFVAIKNSVGDIPFIVVFSSNEYGQMNHSGATIGGLSLSFTGFSE